MVRASCRSATKLRWAPEGAQAGNLATRPLTSRRRTRPLAISASIRSQLKVPLENTSRFPSGDTLGPMTGVGLAKIFDRRPVTVSRSQRELPSASEATTALRLSGIQLMRLAVPNGNRRASPEG